MLPAAAAVERIECSSPDHAPDLLARVRGHRRARRLLLLGHLDTVVAHERHRPAVIEGDLLRGSGTIDMKGGDALALGVLRALAECPDAYAEVALLLVNDEEFRTSPFVHGPRFAGFDACLCFEGGERLADGTEAVVVKRKAATAVQRRGGRRRRALGRQPGRRAQRADGARPGRRRPQLAPRSRTGPRRSASSRR